MAVNHIHINLIKPPQLFISRTLGALRNYYDFAIVAKILSFQHTHELESVEVQSEYCQDNPPLL